MRIDLLAVISMMAVLAGCAGDVPDEPADRATARPAVSANYPTLNYELQIVRAMGWEDLGDSTSTLGVLDRKASAGVLAAPLTAVADVDGRTYVLDGMYHKIVVFGRDGQYERVILGGSGKGPGEFSRVQSMAISGDELYVLDVGNSRVSIFKTDGSHVSSFNLAQVGPARIAAKQDRVYLSGVRLGSGYPAVTVYNAAGAVIDSLARLDGQAANLANSGAVVTLGARPDGALLFGLPMPSQWLEPEHDNQVRGTNHFPDAGGYQRRLPSGMEVGAVPVRAIAITGMKDGSTLVYYVVREGGAIHGNVKDNGFIDVFDEAGVYRGSAALGDSVVYNSMHAVAGGPELVFTTMSTEYPQVRHARLVPLRNAGSDD